MSNGKPMRAVICYDIEIDGGLSDAAKFEALLKDFSNQFEGYIKTKDPDIAKIVNFPKVQAEVPMQERRGETGSLSEFVFRGSRATSSSAAKKEWLVMTSTPYEIHVRAMDGPNEGKDFIFPVEQLPHPMRKYFRNAGAMDGKEISINPRRMGMYGKQK